MKLYYSAGTCSLSPNIVLRELGLPFELIEKKKFVAEGGDYLLVNSKNLVPVLELDSGERLSEGAVIVQYLGDLKPEAGLMPRPGTWERYRELEWLNYVATEIHKGFSPLFNSKLAPEAKQIFYEILGHKFTWLDSQIAAHGPYLMGAQFTAVDAYLYTVLRWAGPLHVDLSKYPALLAYRSAIEARPAVVEALKAEANGHGTAASGSTHPRS